MRIIGKILNKVTGDDKTEKEQSLQSKSDHARAFKMFRDGLSLTEVSIKMDIGSPTVFCYYEDYLKLVNMERLVTIYNDMKDDLPLFLHLFIRIKKEKLNKQDITGLLENQNRLVELIKRSTFITAT